MHAAPAAGAGRARAACLQRGRDKAVCSAQKTPAFVRACRFACAATWRAGPCAPARRPKPKKGGASGTIGAPGGKKAGPARGARAQTARAPFCFGLPHRHHHAFCRLTAAGAAVAPQKGRRARPVRALPPAPGPGPQPEKRTQQKPPAPGAGAGGSSFVRPGPGCSVFRCARFCTKKQSPPCRLRQTKTYLFGRWVPCHGFHAPFFRNGGRSAIPPRTPGSR